MSAFGRSFRRALDESAADRAAFLRHACTGDSDRRREVESLLDAHEAGGGFMARAALDEIEPSVAVGAPIRLFQTRMFGIGRGRDYNVSADGRFLINVNDTGLQPITVVLNWATGLKK